ncbi:MAG TPA: rod shape-determining protein RodA [Rhodospirillaceae bacterium]|nr:rod shape-determining protein RodA [Rhodospirillaceae bacterium]|tara:strand:- start:784 stop:1944 length:1161 start_codon:yes stop_codon:yes gene_type:complete
MSELGFLSARLRRGDMTATEKLLQMSWSLIFWIFCIFTLGFAMLYSAANGSLEPWAASQSVRFFIGLGILLAVTIIDVRIILKYAYIFYFVVLALLIGVEIKGFVGGGAQRWIDLGIFNLQPSELMKPALILALARYFHGFGLDEIGQPMTLVAPVMLIISPVFLIYLQPDLGTALVILMSSAALLFMVGVRIWKFAVIGLAGLGSIPIVWSLLRDYQKNRVLTFLNPEQDPLGTGYHILQSQIALGSGGLFGKGFMEGTQSHLNFLPEHQTDFIFTMLAEELGMIGGLVLLSLYVVILVYGYAIAFRCRHQFGRLVAIGLTTSFFLYFFINIAMVMGLIPVVGMTLPLISYGGTSLLMLMFSMGLLMNMHVHRDVQMGLRGGFGD